MSSQQVVRFYETKRDIVETYLQDSYSLRRDRGWIWLQRISLWVLRKLKCYAVVATPTYTRHTVDLPALAQSIYKQNSELLQLYHLRGERLLIGHKEFCDLVNSSINYPVSFSLPYHSSDSPTVLGMKVTVVPWMSGFLVVPKDFPEPAR